MYLEKGVEVGEETFVRVRARLRRFRAILRESCWNIGNII